MLKEEINTIISTAENSDDPSILVNLINKLAKTNEKFLQMYTANGHDKETMTVKYYITQNYTFISLIKKLVYFEES